MTSNDGRLPALRSLPARLAILFALVVLLIFCIGTVVGFFDAAAEHGPTATDAGIGLVALIVAALCAWQLITRTMRLFAGSQQNVGPSVRKARSLGAFFIATGLVTGVSLSLIQRGSAARDPLDVTALLFTSAPIGANLAAAMLLGLAILTIASVSYYRAIDEHDFASQAEASLLALNVYVVGTIGWWIAARGNLAPQPDHGVIFVVTILAFVAVWWWRRYR